MIFPEVHHHIVAHKHGISKETILRAFECAGLASFEMKETFKAKMLSTGKDVQWFVARGVKPGS